MNNLDNFYLKRLYAFLLFWGLLFGILLFNNDPVQATSTDTWYIGDSSRPTVMAVDVASYQSGMTQANYTKLAALGVKTIIVKATQGTSYTNPYALKQMQYAANAGMNVALYQYATYSSTTEAKAQADYLVSWLEDNDVNTNILIFSDVEASSATVPTVGTNVSTFQSTLSSAGYTNQGFYASSGYTYLSKLIAVDGESKGWIAQYPYHPSSSSLLNSSYGAWQFSSTAMLSGYTGYLDVSYDYTGLLSEGAGADPFGTTSTASSSPSSTTSSSPSSTTSSSSSSTTSSYTLKTISGKTYAYKNNKKVTGWVTIGTKTYYFRTNDGVMLHSWQIINDKTYYFRTSDGVMLRSWQTINGKTYYFYSDGKMLRSWQTINGKTYYFYTDGKMLRSWQTINGKTYYFYTDGKMLRSWQTINGKTYYFYSDGKLLRGYQVISGVTYHFSETTGVLVS
ncbi:GH25 family lysozyme [Liquorilactobacillus mali]|uniref:GH25 family lysozyme n=1 Tax=Liquorilactobacillus mali TaxID=1618 RepID=UPI002653E249|nr:GH25 family lysozyme [Liquorilactobacillus mali]MDN7145641.1 GH25 family lysozyme [Liquorilactobacillus mali]